MKATLAYLIIIFLTSYASASTTISQEYRLDKSIQPESYQIFIKFDVNFNETRKFLIEKCRIKININPNMVSSNITKIRLNYLALEQQSTSNVTLVDKNGEEVSIKLGKPNINTGILQIDLVNSILRIDKEPYILEFRNAIGKIRDDNLGIYLGQYKSANQKKLMIATMFRLSQARSAFPCFDEPSLRANFQLVLTVPSTYQTVVSNTRKISEDDLIGYDLKRFTFAETPKISTYQLGFVVSTFDQLAIPGNPNFNIYCTEENVPHVQYAVNMTPKVVAMIETIMQMNYTEIQSPEIGQVAVPVSFITIQYFGLILYKDTELLYDIKHTTIFELQMIFITLARSLSLMWFGNFGTIEWWSHIWLFQGLVTYLSIKIGAKLAPELELDKQHVVETIIDTFDIDGLFDSQPLTSKEEDIYNVSSILQKSGRISFYKSTTITFMMESLMGEEKFFSALRMLSKTLYSKKGSMNPEKFFKVFESEGLPPGKMREWTEEPGYPVVTVNRVNNSAVLSQKRFLLENNRKSNTKWHIPVSFATETHNEDFANSTPSHWLDPTKDLIIEGAFIGSEWIIVNVHQVGYYRVNYDESLWTKILQLLNSANFGGVPAIIRARLINDVMNMARVMRQSYYQAMDVTKYLKKESDYYPWVAAYNAFSFLLKRIGTKSALGNLLKKYVASLTVKLYKNLKKESTSSASRKSPIHILKFILNMEWFCDNDYPEYIHIANRKFELYKTNPRIPAVNVNYQYAMLCYAIKYGNNSDWDFVLDQYKRSTFPYERRRMLQALGCSRDVVVLRRLLAMTLDPTLEINNFDYNNIFRAVLKSNVDIAQTFLQENIAEISSKYASWNALSTMIKDLTDRFTTITQIEEFKIFGENHQVELKEAFGNLAKSTIKSARANIKWLVTFEDELLEWLTQELDSGSHRPSQKSCIFILCWVVIYLF